MLCWYCHWGWSRAVRDVYDRAARDIDAVLDAAEAAGRPAEPYSGESALEYGPAHVVWADENWDCTGWCLRERDNPLYRDWTPGVMEIVVRSLEELRALPEDVRDPCPADYDGRHPENYPPPPGVEMEARAV